MEKNKLEDMFKEAMNVHLKILSSFFEIIKDDDGQKAIIEFISTSLTKMIEESNGKLKEISLEDMNKAAKFIFWNLNFLTVTALITKIVQSLGSDKLTLIVNKVCDEVNTPASFMVKQGISMWYEKNIQINEIDKRIKKRDFSKIAQNSMKLMIVDYISIHQLNYKEKQKLANKFGITQGKQQMGRR